MTLSAQALFDALSSRGLVSGGPPPRLAVPEPATARPWFVGLLLGASGWLAGLFLLGFVVLVFQPHSSAAAGAAGLISLAAAWGLVKVGRDGAFMGQFALALSIAGQCLVLFAMTEHSRGPGPIAASALPLQIVLALVMPNPVHRALSTFFATIAWALTMRFMLSSDPTSWQGERALSLSLGGSLAIWLLTWLPVGFAVALLVRYEPDWMARRWHPVARPALVGLVLGLAFATLASQPLEPWHWFGDDVLGQGWRALWPLLSALAALAGTAAAFALRHRALLGASALAALLHVSCFYWALGTGLWLKSLLLFSMGGMFLLAARALEGKDRP